MPAGFFNDKRMKMPETLSVAAQERLLHELRPGEELHWAGRPGKAELRHKALTYAFAVAWLALSLCMAWALAHIMGLAAWVLMLPVSLLCFVLDYFMRRRTRHMVYMVTNHRVVWLVLHQPQVHSLALRQNMVSGTVMRASGRGDIIFNADASGDAVDSFYNIPHVRKVVSLINDLSAGR